MVNPNAHSKKKKTFPCVVWCRAYCVKLTITWLYSGYTANGDEGCLCWPYSSPSTADRLVVRVAPLWCLITLSLWVVCLKADIAGFVVAMCLYLVDWCGRDSYSTPSGLCDASGPHSLLLRIICLSIFISLEIVSMSQFFTQFHSLIYHHIYILFLFLSIR